MKKFKLISFSAEVYFRIQGAAVPVGDRICKASKCKPQLLDFFLLFHFIFLYPVLVTGMITCKGKTIHWDKPCNIQLYILLYIHVLVTESDSQIMSSWYHYVVSTGSDVQASSSPVLSVSWCLRMLWRQLTLLHHLFLLKPLVVPPVGWKGHQYGIVDRMLVIDKRGIRMLQLNIWWQNFSKWWAGRKLRMR